MKLEELKQRTDEAASYRFIRGMDGGTGIGLAGSRRGLPTLVLMSQTGSNIKETETIYAIVVKPRVGETLFRSTDPEDTFVELWAQFKFNGKVLNYFHLYKNYPKVFKIIPLNGKANIFKTLTTDLGMPVPLYEQLFGEIPEDLGEEHYTDFHGARVFIPDNTRAANQKAMIDVLESLFQYLKASGFGFLFKGDIRFHRLPGRKIGVYYPKTGDMVIQPSVKKSKLVIYTLIHEFAHKFWYEFMDEAARIKVKEKYTELKRAGISHDSSGSSHSKAKAELAKNIQPGMEFVYKGRKKAFKKWGEFVIKSVDGEKFWAAPTERPDITAMSGSIGIFISNPSRWELKGLELSKEEPTGAEGYDTETEQWFPTPYSETQDEEWWAEIFTFFILDTLKGEPEVFMHDVFGV